MPPTVIENPILNGPYDEPSRHFRFDEQGITGDIVDGRRESGYFLPIATPRKKSGQLKFETEWTEDRYQSSPRINRIRGRVAQWRAGGHVGCTRTTDRLLQYGERRADRQATHVFDAEVQSWLFPQVLGITRQWLAECLHCKDDTFPQLLLLVEFAHDAADRIYQAIVSAHEGEARLKPILRPYAGEETGSTRLVSFDTTKATYATHPDRCHVSHVVLDSDWEAKMAQTLEDLDEVAAYVKNQGVHFTIPYTLNGDERQYYPDYLVRCRSGLNLVVEVSGEGRKDKAAKVNAARTLWIPAINNHGGFGRWAFVEITDPWDAKGTLAAAMRDVGVPA